MTNKLLENAPKKAGRVTIEKLQELADDLNSEWWVRDMGRHYFVKREPNPKYEAGSPDSKKREFIHSLAWNG